MKTKHKKYWQGPSPVVCDMCSDTIVSLFIDGKTIHGSWANMCTSCHAECGVGVGPGLGQKYELDDKGKWEKVQG